MTVKELKEAIEGLPDDMQVIIQRNDEEFSPLSEIDPYAVYIPKTNKSDEVYSMAWTAEDMCMTDEEWEVIKAKPRCLVLISLDITEDVFYVSY
jgi:hypothetical protein